MPPGLSRELKYVSGIPPLAAEEQNMDMQNTSVVESFTVMLNSQEDIYDDESTGGSFIALHTKLHLPKHPLTCQFKLIMTISIIPSTVPLATLPISPNLWLTAA